MSDTLKSLIPITTILSVMHGYDKNSGITMYYLQVPFIRSTNGETLQMVPKL